MRPYSSVNTRDRERTCAEMLRWFESPQYVADQLSHRYSVDTALMETKAGAIASYVAQGREYLEAAKQVTLATQPTLQYYGMACLASAIAISSLPGFRSTDLGRGHGMMLGKSSERADLDGLALHVKPNGTLRDLLRAVSCDYYHLSYDSSDPKVAIAKAARPVSLSPGQSMPLPELLAAVPHVSQLASERYEHWPCPLAALDAVQLQQLGNGGPFRLVVRPGRVADKAAWEHLLGQGYSRAGEVGMTEFAEIVSPEEPTYDDLPLTSLLRDLPSGGYWYLYNSDPYLLMPRVVALTAVGFAFGFLARYRPEQWSRLAAGVDSPAVHVIRRFTALVFDEFPLLALRELSDSHVALGPSWAQLEE